MTATENPKSEPPRGRSSSGLRWIGLACLLVLTGLLAAGIYGHLRQKRAQEDFARENAAVHVEIVHVHARDKDSDLILPANVTAVHQTTLNARVNGYIAKWLVDIGDPVKEGQLLAEIAAPELDQQLAQARQQLQEAQASYELARANAKRSSELVVQQAVSIEEDDTDQSAFRAADASVKAGQANVDQFLAMENFKKVTAPFAGKITDRSIDIGSLVTAGSGTAGTPLYTLAATNPLNIFANVPQSLAPSIHTGLKVKLLVEEYPNRDFEATVVRTAEAIDPASRTLNTEMQIENDDGALYAGMYIRVKFNLGRDGAPVVIPATAFVFRQGGSQVAVLTKENRVHWQKIQVGRDFGDEMEVLSGLADNDAVILNPTDDLTEGLAVLPEPPGGAK